MSDREPWADEADDDMREWWRELEKFEPLPSLDGDEEGEDG